MDERFLVPIKKSIRKERRQMSLWISTAEIVTLLSEHTGISKTEVIHLAIVDMAKAVLPGPINEE